jgi:predicted nuclease of predicted toxin-antitoxin system
VIRCEEVGNASAADAEHLRYATEHQCAMVSHDKDFLRLDAEWKRGNKSHTGIFFIQQELQLQPGRVVTALVEYAELVENGAALLTVDVHNQVIYIG